jgi:hypothetical protein
LAEKREKKKKKKKKEKKRFLKIVLFGKYTHQKNDKRVFERVDQKEQGFLSPNPSPKSQPFYPSLKQNVCNG